MNTASHLLMTAALRRAWGRNDIPRSAVWLGAVAPDLPLYLVSAAALVYYRSVLGWPGDRAFGRMYDDLYFQDPFWIASHNLLHAPLILAVGLLGCRLLSSRRPGPAAWGMWFFGACALHTAVDLLTHYDDGPLPFFPLDWHTRWRSPVSYWDPAHYGRPFAVFERTLDLGLLAYLLIPPLVRRWRTRREHLS